MLSKAISIAAQAFEGKYDKEGNPCILHCLHVMNAVKDYSEDYMIVAVLHDLLENTNWTAQMLLDKGFSESLVIAIKHLTHIKGEPYDVYIEFLSKHPIARIVKMADLSCRIVGSCNLNLKTAPTWPSYT